MSEPDEPTYFTDTPAPTDEHPALELVVFLRDGTEGSLTATYRATDQWGMDQYRAESPWTQDEIAHFTTAIVPPHTSIGLTYPDPTLAADATPPSV